MSDVIVSTTESTTDVTTTNDVTTVAITDTTVEVSQATAGFQGVPGSNSDPTYVFVRNSTGALLPKGSIVYVSGANGVHTQVSLALATGDVTSARTLGWLAENIANNASGLCCVEGYLDGVNTQGVTEGAQLYLSPTTPGAFTETKPSAPDHMVYVGICAKASSGNGRVFVHVQNGAELEELHDVKIVSPQNNDLLRYVSGTALWENVASTAITVGSAIVAGTSVYATNAGTSVYASTAGTSVYATNAGTAVDLSGSITKSQVSDFTAGTVASASTAQQAGTAVYATTSGSASVAGSAVAYTGSITISQITDLANATVTSAATAQQAGTALYALTSGTAEYATTSGTSVYATTSGTAVTISGTITNSQVSDFASGTVANISGTVTQAQVSGLGSALAGKAGLADNNTFTGTNTFSNFTTFQAASDAIPIRIFGANGQSADLFSVNDYLTNTQFEILSDGRAQSLKGIIATVSGTASIPLVVRGTAGQSADLLQIQNSGSTAVFSVLASGVTNISISANATALVVNAPTGQSNDLQSWNVNNSQLARIGADGSIRTNANFGSITPGKALFSPNGDTNGFLLNTQGTANKGLVVRGASGQNANLQEWQNSGSTVIARVDKNGAVSANYFGPSATGLLGYLDWTTSSPLFQTGGTAVVGLRVRGASGQSANLQEWQSNTGGTVGVVTPTGTFRTAGLISAGDAVNVLGQLSVTSTAASRIGAVIRGEASQSANLTEWQLGDASVRSSVSANGRFAIRSVTLGDAAASLYVGAINTTDKPVVVRGAASQSANLQEWQDSTGGTAARVNNQGSIILHNAGTTTVALSAPAGFGAFYSQTTSTIPIIARRFTGQTANILELQDDAGGTATWFNSSGYLRINGDPGGQLGITTFNASSRGIVVRGAASQSANLQEWQTSSGSTAALISSAGTLRLTNITDTASTGSFFRFNAANLQVDTRTSTNTGLIISGVASQTGDLQTWTNAGAGTVFARVSASGQIASGGTAVAGPSFLGQITAIPASTATVGVVVQGLSGQSANLQTWQNSGGTVLASIDSVGALSVSSGNATINSGGVIRGVQVATNNDYVSLRQENAGGFVRLTRGTAAVTNPGANLGALYFRDGTNAGTLKLVVRAGTAGAETTILDNIPT